MEPCTIALHDHTGDNVLERLAQANLLCRIVLRVSAGPDQWPHLTAFSSRVRHRMIRSSTEGGTSRLVLCSQTSDIHCPTCTRITRAASVQLRFRCLQRAISLIWLGCGIHNLPQAKGPGSYLGRVRFGTGKAGAQGVHRPSSDRRGSFPLLRQLPLSQSPAPRPSQTLPAKASRSDVRSQP